MLLYERFVMCEILDVSRQMSWKPINKFLCT